VSAEIDDAGSDANVHVRIREDDPRLKEVVESFDDSVVVGCYLEDEYFVMALRLAGTGWSAHVSQVEARLDRLGFDWRAAVTCRRPN
jgi:hypothetical protein